jgi:hypothetical protein
MFSLRALLQIGFIVLCVSVLGGGFLHQQLPVNAQMSPLTDRIEWTTIADSYYGYSFQIPAHWHKEMGVTPDRWTFYGELTFGKSQGFIKIDFAADPVGHWLPEPEIRNPDLDERATALSTALIPFLPAGTWMTINGIPALIVRESVQEGEGPFVEGTSIYILAERMVYHLWIGYAPPVGTDKATYARFITTARQIEAHILGSFSVTSEGGQ